MAAQGIAGDDLGLTVRRSRVEIIDPVLDGVVHHLVDGVLVEACTVACACALNRRKTHTSQAEHTESDSQAVPVAGADLAPFGSLGQNIRLCGRHTRAGTGSAGLQK